MSKIHNLAQMGQTLWLDYLRRSLLTSGELKNLIDQGITGVTSNPSIFEKAILGSQNYDEDIKRLTREKKSLEEIYETLVFEDIIRACDLLRGVYEQSKGQEGFVSLEVNPFLAHDLQETVKEAKRLFQELNRPNVLIKIPSTPIGIEAIKILIEDGVNINATLIFSQSQYEGVAEAYLCGLENFRKNGGNLHRVHSVASLFVSRIDTAVDQLLEKRGISELRGQIAIANAKIVYQCFRKSLQDPRWQALAKNGGNVQRLLWASTATKNPHYSDTLYVDRLIGPNTVNTLPVPTLNAFLRHGKVGLTLEKDIDIVKAQIYRLRELDVNLENITETLLQDGVAAFQNSFKKILKSIEEKCEMNHSNRENLIFDLGPYQKGFDGSLEEFEGQKIMKRIWNHDHTVWKPEPSEISNRLGWLQIMDSMMENLPRINSLTKNLQKEGYRKVILLGMGGSSLAPEVFHKTFGVKKGFLDLQILDSTDPSTVLNVAERIDPEKTLFIVSSKSGGTIETLSFFNFFYNRMLESLGKKRAGKHFIAITDPGSLLEEISKKYQFRSIFLNDPQIGGRYSALSYFGLVPASLIGVDIKAVLQSALTMASNCEANNGVVRGNNRGGLLGLIMGELAKNDCNKLTLFCSPKISSFGDWVEQLVAESTGKEGKGILPVIGEPLQEANQYGKDRYFVYIKCKEDDGLDSNFQNLKSAGTPYVEIQMQDLLDLGGQFFLWEMATAVCGSRLNINPFDQPDVETAKMISREIVSEFKSKGKLPEEQPILKTSGVDIFADFSAKSLSEAFCKFLEFAKEGSYLSIQAFIKRSKGIDQVLKELQTLLRDKTKNPTTIGYGPRYLHSTGQIHKGDSGKGLFIQLTSDDAWDAAIPEVAGNKSSSISFGILKMAQAMGDYQALINRDRKVIRFHFSKGAVEGIKKLIQALNC